MGGWVNGGQCGAGSYRFLNISAIHNLSLLSGLLLDPIYVFICNIKHFYENEEWNLVYFKQKI